MDEARFRELISGARRGLVPAALRGGLRLLSFGYGLGARYRNRQFDRGTKPAVKAPIPVISIGNLTTGGTGKTPLAAFIARWFRNHNVRVCFLSRGYRAQAGGQNDEALVLEQLCPDVPHLQGADRVHLASIAHEELDSQLLILDDGFQHRQLSRDLDIVLLDALNPWGYGALLPRGLLREPLSGLRRAHLVILTRCNHVSAETLGNLLQRVRQIAPQLPVVETGFAPCGLINSRGETAELIALHNRPVAAFCGIGNPAGFRQTLEQAGFQPRGLREFADHHHYTRSDIEDLVKFATEAGAQALLTTQKDLVKIASPDLQGIPVWALEIETQVLAGNSLLDQQLCRILAAVE